MTRILFPVAAAVLLAASVLVTLPASAAGPATARQAKAVPAAAAAKPVRCHDAKGKFTKCATAAAKPKQCRDSKGKFIKCAA